MGIGNDALEKRRTRQHVSDWSARGRKTIGGKLTRMHMSYSSEHQRLRPVLERAGHLDIATQPAPNALFDALNAGFNLWCTPDDHPTGWGHIQMDAGAFSKPCEYLGTVTWGWTGEQITHLELSTDAYALHDRDGGNYTRYRNRADDIAWAKAKVGWLFSLAGVECPLITVRDEDEDNVPDHPTAEATGDRVSVRSEDILTAEQTEVLQRADRGEIPCPHCGQPLSARMVVSTMPDLYEGVHLFCRDGACGFSEW